MWSVNKHDESFGPAAVAAAQEPVSTVCSLWMSVKTHLVPQIKLTAWTCKLGGRSWRSSQVLQNEGRHCSSTEQAFDTRF